MVVTKRRSEVQILHSQIVELREQKVDLLAALEILRRVDKQLEATPLGYFIFRLNKEDMTQIADAIAKAKWQARP